MPKVGERSLRDGDKSQRRANRAKMKARNLAKTIDEYDLGADGACQAQLDELCAELCAAQDLATQEAAAAAARAIGSSRLAEIRPCDFSTRSVTNSATAS
mgnify:CR=1 FL=1